MSNPKTEVTAMKTKTESNGHNATAKPSGEELLPFFELSLDLLCIAGTDGYFRRLNPAFESTLGWSLAELLAKPFFDFIHPEDVPATQTEIAKLAQGIDTVHFEHRFRCQNGAYKWLAWTGRPTADGALYATARDITHHKQIAEELAQERQLLRTVIDNIPDHIYVKDTQGRFILGNMATVRSLGMASPTEIVGKTDFDFSPPEFAAKFQAEEQALFRAGQSPVYKEDVIFDHLTGEQRWIQTTKALMRDSQGQVTGFVGLNRDISAQKQAEEALLITQFSLDHAFYDVIWLDPEARIVYVNETACSNLGYSQSELLSMTIFDINPDPNTPNTWSAHWAELKQRQSFTFDTQHRRKNGQIFPVDVAVNYLNFNGKEYNCVFVKDITAQKQAEEALQESQRMLQLVMDNVPQRVFWKDKNLVYLGCNRLFAGDAGLSSPEEIIGKTDSNMPWQDQAELYTTDDRAVMEANAPKLNYEEPQTTPTGERIWLQTSKVPLHDAQGNVMGILGMYGDITERKRAEEALARERNLLRTLIDNIPDAHIFVKDAQSRFLMTNIAHLKTLGVNTMEEVLGKTDFDFFPPELAEQYYTNEQTIIQSGKPLSNHIEPVIDPTGQQKWYLTNKLPLLDESNTVIGLVGMSLDITEQKRSEEELRKYQDQLEQLVEARTSELEDRLRELNNLQRLMTREGWQEYQVANQQTAYRYNQGLVQPAAIEELQPPGNGTAKPERAKGRAENDGYLFTRPMTIQGEVIGALGVQIDSNNSLTSGDQEFLAAISEQVAEALERARLLDQSQKRAGEMETIAQVGVIAASTLEVQSLLQTVVDLTKSRFGLYHAHIYLLDDEGDNLVLAAGAGEPGQKLVAQGWRISYNHPHSIVALAARNRQGVIVNNTRQNPNFLPNPLLPNTRAELAVPMLAGDKLLGILDVQADMVDRFTEDDVRLKTTLANQVAIALQNARLFNEQQQARHLLNERIKELNCLNDIGREIEETPPIPEFLEWVTQRIPPATHHPELCRVAIEFGDVTYGIAEAVNIPHQMTHAIRVGNEVVGRIYIAYTEKQDFLNEESSLLGGVARRVSGYIENRRLFGQIQANLAETSALYHLGTQLNQVRTFEELADVIASIETDTKVDGVTLLTLEVDQSGTPEWSEIVASHTNSEQPALPKGTRFYLPQFPMRSLWINDPYGVVIIGNIATDDRVDPITKAAFGSNNNFATVFLPLAIAGRWIGLITLNWPSPQVFTEKDTRIFQSIARQTAVVMNNLLLFAQTQAALGQTQAALAETNTLFRVAQALTQMDDERMMFEFVLTEYLRVLNLSQGGVLITDDHDPNFGTLKALMVRGKLVEPGLQVPMIGNPASEKVVNTRRAVVINDALHDPLMEPVRDFVRQMGYKSLLLAPIVVRETVYGVLGADAVDSIHEFTEREVAFVQAMADQLGIAIENRRLLAETQTALAQVEATQRRYTVQVWETYLAKNKVASYEQVRAGTTPLGDNLLPEINQAIVEGQQPAANSHSLVVNPDQPGETDSSLIVPLAVRGQTIGVLGLQETESAKTWLPEEIALVEAIARQMAEVAENLRLVDETQQRAAREKRVNEISEKVQAAQSLEEALQIAIQEIGVTLQAPQTIVHLEV